MGQKVNPVGFRTGIMIGWKSRWYASKQEFAELLVEDQKIRDFIKYRKDKGGKPLYPSIAKIEIERTRDEVKVILFSARPGVLIGRKGERVEEMQKELQQKTGRQDKHQDRGNQPAGNSRPVGGRRHRGTVGKTGRIPADDEAVDGTNHGSGRERD